MGLPYMPISWGGLGGQWGGSPMAVPWSVWERHGQIEELARNEGPSMDRDRCHGPSIPDIVQFLCEMVPRGAMRCESWKG